MKTSPRTHLVILATILTLALQAIASAQTILIDFGSNTTQMPSPNGSTYWNNVTQTMATSGGGASTGTTVALLTTLNAASGITLTITDLFSGENTLGTASPTTSVAAFNFSNLGSDSLYVDSGNLTGGFTLTGLSSAYTYSFTIFSSRNGVADIRTGDYTFTGLTGQTVTLNASNNTSTTVATGEIAPDLTNKITFSMQKAATNNNGSGFAYLGGLQIVATAVVPEPSSLALLSLGAISLVSITKRRRTATA